MFIVGETYYKFIEFVKVIFQNETTRLVTIVDITLIYKLLDLII